MEIGTSVAKEMNSGVQFRSEFYTKETTRDVAGKQKKFPADRVFGYQYEIDPRQIISVRFAISPGKASRARRSGK